MGSRAPLTRAQAVALASDAALGRFPGQGSAQNDTFPYNDNVDNNSPAYIDYVLPKNFQRIVSARLSIRNRAYRTYNNFTVGGGTGAETGHSHSHAHTSAAHSHSHGHSLHILYNAGIVTSVGSTGAGGFLEDNVTGVDYDTATIANANAQSTTPGSTGTNAASSSGHTHPISSGGNLGVTEAAAPVNPGTTIAFDGVDRTAALGGPFNVDVVELDITKFISTAVSLWHTVTLQPNQLVRLVALLRISYYVDSRLAQ